MFFCFVFFFNPRRGEENERKRQDKNTKKAFIS